MEFFNQIGIIIGKLFAVIAYLFAIILSPTGAASASNPPDFEIFRIGSTVVTSVDVLFFLTAALIVSLIEIPHRTKLILWSIIAFLIILLISGILPSLIFNIALTGVIIAAFVFFFRKPLE